MAGIGAGAKGNIVAFGGLGRGYSTEPYLDFGFHETLSKVDMNRRLRCVSDA